MKATRALALGLGVIVVSPAHAGLALAGAWGRAACHDVEKMAGPDAAIPPGVREGGPGKGQPGSAVP